MYFLFYFHILTYPRLLKMFENLLSKILIQLFLLFETAFVNKVLSEKLIVNKSIFNIIKELINHPISSLRTLSIHKKPP